MLRSLGQRLASGLPKETKTSLLSLVGKQLWVAAESNHAAATVTLQSCCRPTTGSINVAPQPSGTAVIPWKYGQRIVPDTETNIDHTCGDRIISSTSQGAFCAAVNMDFGAIEGCPLEKPFPSLSSSSPSCSTLCTQTGTVSDMHRCMSLPARSASLCRSIWERQQPSPWCSEANRNRTIHVQSQGRHRPCAELSPSLVTLCSLNQGEAAIVACCISGVSGWPGLQCREVVRRCRNGHYIQVRGIKIAGSEVRLGNVIERRGRLVLVLKTSHTQHGRGGASIQLETRDLQEGWKRNERLRPSEEVERVRLYERHYIFLYTEGDEVVLMEPSTFEQLSVPKSMFGGKEVYLTDGMNVVITVHGEKEELLPLMAEVPSQVTLKVIEAEPYARNQTATAMSKPAILENGVKVQVPSFVVAGDSIVINTMDNSFVRRARDGP